MHNDPLPMQALLHKSGFSPGTSSAYVHVDAAFHGGFWQHVVSEEGEQEDDGDDRDEGEAGGDPRYDASSNTGRAAGGMSRPDRALLFLVGEGGGAVDGLRVRAIFSERERQIKRAKVRASARERG